MSAREVDVVAVTERCHKRRERRSDRLLAHFPRDVARLLRAGGIRKVSHYAGRVRRRNTR